MGRELMKTIRRTEDLELTGAFDIRGEGQDAGELIESGETGIILHRDLEQMLSDARPEVVVDFTTPTAAGDNIKTVLRHGVRPVVGTTGIDAGTLEEVRTLAAQLKTGCVIAPNFALGAVLMMRFAAGAARYFPHVEIIELHHDQKVDAPSGTAVKTAELIAQSRGEFHPDQFAEIEKVPGARGGCFDGIHLHSVRLPGLVAHQEVIFGGLGQTLTIRHDSISRESFMPGVLIAIHKVMQLEGVVYGLENLLFD